MFGVMSTCINCRKTKKSEYYNKNKFKIQQKQDRYREQNKDKLYKSQQTYRQKFPYKIILNSIKQRCNNKNNNSYKTYGSRGIKNFLTLEDIIYLMKRDCYDSMERPTIDRIDNNGHYTLENCRFIEKSENSAKDKRKPINQYDLNGKLLRKFISISDANRYLKVKNSHIQEVASGKRKTCLGFMWRFEV